MLVVVEAGQLALLCQLLKWKSHLADLKLPVMCVACPVLSVSTFLPCFTLLFILVSINLFIDERMLDTALRAMKDQHLEQKNPNQPKKPPQQKFALKRIVSYLVLPFGL